MPQDLSVLKAEEVSMALAGKVRKRPPTEGDIDCEKRARTNDPLRDIVACLTGLTHGKKTHFHELIESLGGRYTRAFDLDKNTHLIAETPDGAKYDLATTSPRIHIVNPSWIISCSQEGKRVDENLHLLRRNDAARKTSIDVVSEIDVLLDLEAAFHSLFASHRFYMLGFEEDEGLKRKLGRLIRRGMGTIFWDLNDAVSIVVLHDTSDDSLRKAAKNLTENHINMPPTVSPAWVIQSLKKNCLASPSQFPPVSMQSLGERAPVATSKQVLKRSTSTSAVFRGCLFSLARIAPPTWAADFDSKQQEALIKSNGGQLLSLRLIDAMQVDASNGGQRRKCYVVCWGGRPQLQLNPFLSQLQRQDLCDIVQVTPIWLKTCITTQKRIGAEALPLALFPQSWPLRKLQSKVVATLSGFAGTQKRAIAELISCIGGTCTDNMTNSNTHLICQGKASNLKIEKASEWGLHVVSIDWLKHIAEFGFFGRKSEKGGCESHFVFGGATL